MSGFVRSIQISHCGNDETGQNALCGRYFNNRLTGKDATKPRTLGLLGHSDIARDQKLRDVCQVAMDQEVETLPKWVKSIAHVLKCRIRRLIHSVKTRHESIFCDPEVVSELSRLHEIFVIDPADKASNTYRLSEKGITTASWERNLDLTRFLGTLHTIVGVILFVSNDISMTVIPSEACTKLWNSYEHEQKFDSLLYLLFMWTHLHFEWGVVKCDIATLKEIPNLWNRNGKTLDSNCRSLSSSELTPNTVVNVVI